MCGSRLRHGNRRVEGRTAVEPTQGKHRGVAHHGEWTTLGGSMTIPRGEVDSYDDSTYRTDHSTIHILCFTMVLKVSGARLSFDSLHYLSISYGRT